MGATKFQHEGRKTIGEKAVLVGVVHKQQSEAELNDFLDELAFLALTAGAIILKRFTQKLEAPNPKTFIGKGKLEEIEKYAKEKAVEMVIFDDELSPSQQNNLEEALGIKIIDRTGLILDIFAGRARSAQAKTQVDLAQMEYLLPRLKGLWTHLERQQGGIGMRGPGEREIETDRRVITTKISQLKAQLSKIDRQSATQRKQRSQYIRVALVGYTNVGKSTLMNLISKSDVFAEDKLFATLDTTVRKISYKHVPFLLSDTVGFIRKLPHTLIESFKSTLDELIESDLYLHVIDLSHPNYEEQIKVVDQTLIEIGAIEKPSILVFNKMDKYAEQAFDELLPSQQKLEILSQLKSQWEARSGAPCVFISATQKSNIEELRKILNSKVRQLYMKRHPYNQDPGEP